MSEAPLGAREGALIDAPSASTSSFGRASLYLGIGTLTTILVGFARAKFLAVTVGPSGVGEVAIATEMVAFGVTLACLGLGDGLVRAVARAEQDKSFGTLARSLRYALAAQLSVATAIVLIVRFSPEHVAMWIFGHHTSNQIMLGALLGIPCGAVVVTAYSILQGLRRSRAIASLRAGAAIISFAVLVLLVRGWGVTGAVAGVGVTYGLGLLCVLLYLRPLLPVLGAKPTAGGHSELVKYSATTLAAGVILQGTSFTLRVLVARTLSTAIAGYYQIAYALSFYYTPFFTNGVWSHYYPLACTIKESKELRRELIDTVEGVLVSFTVAGAGLLLLRPWVIRIIWTKAFLPAAPVLGWQVLSDVFSLTAYIVESTLYARGQLRQWLAGQCLTAVAWAALFLVLVPHAGASAITAALCGANILKLGITLYFLRAAIGVPVGGAILSRVARSAFVLFLAGIPSLVDLRVGVPLATVAITLALGLFFRRNPPMTLLRSVRARVIGR